MKIRLFQKGFNYSQDGPGNRLVYHLQGCNMRCPWCANPEGLDLDGVLMVRKGALLSEFCPYNAICDNELDRIVCASCKERTCLHERRNQYISFSCKEYDTGTLVQEAVESRSMFVDGGGVTVSGGEPTLQFEALKELLSGLNDTGIHTAMESNGTHSRLPELFSFVKLLILDLKCIDKKKHLAVTSVGNDIIKKNIKSALHSHPCVWIRIPLVEGFNTYDEDLKGLLSFFGQCDTSNASVEFLRYHEYGKDKWVQCGYPYRPVNAFVSDETVKRFERECANIGLNILHT